MSPEAGCSGKEAGCSGNRHLESVARALRSGMGQELQNFEAHDRKSLDPLDRLLVARGLEGPGRGQHRKGDGPCQQARTGSTGSEAGL